MSKSVVPEEMLRAAAEAWETTPHSIQGRCADILEAALQWLDIELEKMKVENRLPWQAGHNEALEKVRHMFLAPGPEQSDDICHLVRGRRTLCGLQKWSAGNVDIDFGIEHTTNCLNCLKAIALERRAPTPTDETPKKPEAPEVMYIMRHFDDIGMDEKELLNRARAAVSDTVAHFARAEKIKPIDLEER